MFQSSFALMCVWHSKFSVFFSLSLSVFCCWLSTVVVVVAYLVIAMILLLFLLLVWFHVSLHCSPRVIEQCKVDFYLIYLFICSYCYLFFKYYNVVFFFVRCYFCAIFRCLWNRNALLRWVIGIRFCPLNIFEIINKTSKRATHTHTLFCAERRNEK